MSGSGCSSRDLQWWITLEKWWQSVFLFCRLHWNNNIKEFMCTTWRWTKNRSSLRMLHELNICNATHILYVYTKFLAAYVYILYMKWLQMYYTHISVLIRTEQNVQVSPMQITWPWPPMCRFSQDLITLRQTETWT